MDSHQGKRESISIELHGYQSISIEVDRVTSWDAKACDYRKPGHGANFRDSDRSYNIEHASDAAMVSWGVLVLKSLNLKPQEVIAGAFYQ